MIKLRDKDIEKLSGILQIPSYAIEKMSSMNLINDGLAIDMLITHDWKSVKRGRKYRSTLIIAALANEYQVSETKVKTAIYGKRKHIYSCSRCGRRVKKGEYVRNDTLCDACVTQTIEL